MRFGIYIEATRLVHICQGVYNVSQMPKRNKPFALDLLFRALADPTRLRLLNLIAAVDAHNIRIGRKP